jgi:Glycosyl transferases group 1
MSVRSLKPFLICFSHLRWDFVTQRPQHLLSRAADEFDVVFVEEPVESHDRENRLVLTKRGSITVAVPHLQKGLSLQEANSVRNEFAKWLRRTAGTRKCIGWYYTPEALTYTADLAFDAVVYDCMDELALFKGAGPIVAELERVLLSVSDVVFTGGRSLFQAKSRLHKNVHCFPSSIDVAHFAQALKKHDVEPADQSGIPRPRIGYYAVIDERFDPALTEKVASIRSDLQFVILGPVVKIDPASLPKRSNIHWLGQKTYAELPAYLAGWDAAFMPFALNESTRFISPTKTPEFLAAGLPVVSTAVKDVVDTYGTTGLVEIANTPEQMAEQLDIVLRRNCPTWKKAVEVSLAAQSWDKTWASMSALIHKQLHTQPARVFTREGSRHV